MKLFKKTLLASLLLLASQNLWAKTITLDGKTINAQAIADIAQGAEVAVSEAARMRAEKSFQTLLNAAKTGQKIYGFTVGVGWNKDRDFVTVNGELDEALIAASKDFNKGLIRAHVGAVGEPLPIETVRAIMATRLNMVLSGSPGLQPAFIDTYVAMLNQQITPVVPSMGSIGQADITVLAHIALNMIGEGEVFYQGKKVPAAQAFKAAGITLSEPYGKDALAILSTNAQSLGLAALNIKKLERLNANARLIYALSLEALDGNVSPILEDNVRAKGFVAGEQTAAAIRDALKGSYLWQASAERAVQDPLSFRDAVWVLSTLEEATNGANDKLNIQLNHGDDNPTVVVDVTSDDASPEVQKRYVKGGGALFSSANFDPSPWLLSFESATIALANSANASVQRLIKLNHPEFIHLSRFLGTDKTYHAFGAMEKPPVALAREIQLLANPASVATTAVAGNIEDVATNAPIALLRQQTAIDNYAYILGMELIHAAQAIDLRLQNKPDLALGEKTRALYAAFRKQVAFLAEDRPLSGDFETAKRFVESYQDVK